MAPLGLLLRANLVLVHAEEFVRLSRMFSSDIVKCGRRNVIGLALTHQAVVIQQVLLLSLVARRLRFENPLSLSPVTC